MVDIATIGAIIAISVNFFILLLTIAAAVYLFMVTKNEGVTEVQKAASLVPIANESITYSEVPMAVVCVIAHHFQIPLQDVAQEYVKDSESRSALILANFRKDPLSDYFIGKYQSKFIAHGYIGEELLTQ